MEWKFLRFVQNILAIKPAQRVLRIWRSQEYLTK
jgi:hypothetical protein